MARGTTASILVSLLCALLALGWFAGSASASSTVVFSDDFESALKGWTTSGTSTWNTASPVIGAHDIKLLPKNSSIQRTVSTVGWQEVTVSFWLAGKLSRKGAVCQALWYDGSTWNLLKELRTGGAEADGQLHYYEFALPASATNNSKFAVRFRLSTKPGNDAGYVDNVTVSAGGRFLYTLTLAGVNGSVKVNGISQSLPWSGAFDYGASVVLQAEADTGYHFTGWSGALTGASNPEIIVLDKNKDISAGFAVNSYRLAIGSGTGHGSIKVDGVLQSLPWVGEYDGGTTVLLEAVPDAGYDFAGWAGGLMGTTNPEFITMDGDQSVSTGFAIDTYVLLLSGSGGGVKVDGVYHALPDTVSVPYNSTVTLEAVPDTGSHFTGWSGDLSSSAQSDTLLIDSDKSVTAGFAPNQYALNLSGVGNGNVRVDGVDHALPWFGTYGYGDIVTLEAAPGADSHFSYWSGDLEGTANPTLLVIDGDKDIEAYFGLNTYTLALTGTNGTVKVNGAPKTLPWSGFFAAGEVVYLEATPAEGFGFAAWSGDLTGAQNPTSITMDGNRAVVAEFGVNLLSLAVSGTHGSLNVDGIPQAFPYFATYDYGAVVNLEAVPELGYQFDQWSGNVTGAANPIDVTVFDNSVITASFSLASATLNLTGSGGAVKVNGVVQTLPWSGSFYQGTSVTLEAVPDSCMGFRGWSGDVTGTSRSVTFAIDGNKAATPVFSSIVIFNDVACDAWGAAEIATCFDAGIVHGYDATTYNPSLPVTRDQMAVYVSRALAGGDEYVPTHPAKVSFADVPAGYWAYPYIEYAAEQGIVTGLPGGKYEPGSVVNRGQMAVFVARCIAPLADRPLLSSYTPPTTPTFADVTAANEWGWASKYVEYIAAQGVTHGYPDMLYHPEYDCTRDQMAVYMARALGLPL